MNKDTLLTVFASVISGIISGIFITNGNLFGGIFTFDMPGLAFGVLTAGLYLHLHRIKLSRAILWVIASAISWRIALHLYLLVYDTVGAELLHLPIAGAVGGLILASSFWLIIQKFEVKHIISVVATGLVAALGMYVIFNSTEPEALSYPLAFALWQVSVSVALSRFGFKQKL